MTDEKMAEELKARARFEAEVAAAQPLTVEDIVGKCHLRFCAHLDGNDKRGRWFADVHEVVEHPRLSRMAKAWRRGAAGGPAQVTTWWTDGTTEHPTLDAAVAALATPPTLTPDERAALDAVDDEWRDLRRPGITQHLLMLSHKGVIEFKDGKCRRRAGATFT